MNTIEDDALLILLTSVVGKMQRQLSGALSMHGIGFTEYLVLRHLHESPEGKLRRIDLAEKVGLSASGVTRLLNPMHKIGLVAKESAPRDARVSLVALTDSGKRIFEESSTTFRAMAERILSKIDDSRRDTLVSIVASLD